MTSLQYTVLFSAPVSGTGTSAGSVADIMIPDASTGLFVKATTANRGTRRSWGFALSSYAAGGAVDIQQVGVIDTATAGLGAGTASWVRCSTTGQLERATVSGTDDVVGWVETDGTFHACFGFLTAAIVNGGGAAVVPTGTGIPHIVGGAQNAAASLIVDADVTAVGVAKLTGLGTNVSTLLTSVLAAGYTTFAVTPSGANLASLLTSALPVSKGGTGLTALTIPASALLVGTTDLQTLTNKTLTSPTINVTRISNVTSGGTINNCTLSGLAGTVIHVYFTDAIGPTVTGFDVTTVSGGAVVEGTILRVVATGGTVAFNHENAGSTAANRITCGGLTINLPSGSHVDFMYDATGQRWRAGAGTGI